MSVCAGTKRNGTACTLPATQGSAFCWNHDPARAEERSRNAKRAATLKHDSVAKEIRGMREDIRELIHLTVNDELPAMARKKLTDMVQLSQTYARLTELELAAGGKPERGSVALGLDLPEKARQYVAAEEPQDSEADGDEAELSDMEALAEDAISMFGMDSKDAAALRHVGRILG